VDTNPPGNETDIAPAAAGTRSDHAGSAPQAGSGASETGPAPVAGEGEHLAGEDPQTDWLRDAEGGPDGGQPAEGAPTPPEHSR